MTRRHIVVLTILCKQKVVLVQNPRHLANVWRPPAARKREKETPDQALIRVLSGELGIYEGFTFQHMRTRETRKIFYLYEVIFSENQLLRLPLVGPRDHKIWVVGRERIPDILTSEDMQNFLQ